MSEIYKRSLGMTYDRRALDIELGGGTSGYDPQPIETVGDDLRIDTPATQLDALRNERMQWNMVEAVSGGLSDDELAERTLLDAEIVLREYEEKMAEVVTIHPKYTWHVGQILIDRLDAMKAQGHPVDAEMYIEAQDLADEIVAANPDKDAGELTEVVETMVAMVQAEARHRQLTMAA